MAQSWLKKTKDNRLSTKNEESYQGKDGEASAER